MPQSLLRDQVAQSMQDALKAVAHVACPMAMVSAIRSPFAASQPLPISLWMVCAMTRCTSGTCPILSRLKCSKALRRCSMGVAHRGGLINRITKKPGGKLQRSGFDTWARNQRRGEFTLARAPEGMVWCLIA